MKTPPADPLLERILYDRKLSGGRMPIEILVADEDEKARGIQLCRGLRGTGNLTFVTDADVAARIGRQCRRWKAQAARGEELA